MKFIDENSLNRLNFKELLSRVDIFSAYGKNKLNNVQNFLVGEEEKLEEEFERMQKILDFISVNKKEEMEIEIILHRLKDIKKLVENTKANIILDTVDLFEIKTQLMAMADLNVCLIKNKEVFSDFILKDLDELFKILDPNNEKIATFYIYESYSVILKEIRRQKKEVENKLFNETDYETIQKLKNERLSILVDEEREEFKIRRNLTALVKEFSSIFLNNTEKIGNFFLVDRKTKVSYFIYLLVVLLGAGTGIFLFANIIKYSITNYPKITVTVFTLLILPSIPYIVKGLDYKKKKKYLSFLLWSSSYDS